MSGPNENRWTGVPVGMPDEAAPFEVLCERCGGEYEVDPAALSQWRCEDCVEEEARQKEERGECCDLHSRERGSHDRARTGRS